MRRLVRQLRRRTSSDDGFSLASLLVAMAVLGLVAALSTAALGDAYRSTTLLRTSVGRTLDASNALDYLTSVTGPGLVTSATADTLTVSTDEQDSCVQHVFTVNNSLKKFDHQSLALPLPAGGRCEDIAASVWTDAWNLRTPRTETLAYYVYPTSAFTYFTAGNAELTTLPVADTCDIARVLVTLTIKGAQGTEQAITQSVPLARQAFGAECPS